jgi:hypothetical protein
MVARLSALHAGRFLPPRTFLVLIFVRGWVDPRITVRLKELGKLKGITSSGIRTGDLPACSIVPQPTTLPHAPYIVIVGAKFIHANRETAAHGSSYNHKILALWSEKFECAWPRHNTLHEITRSHDHIYLTHFPIHHSRPSLRLAEVT